jgi:nanoRNase/pAp phosphatase (c-di-AMP/oligoRNAs hydrolase)
LILQIYKLSLRSHSKDIDLGYICSIFGGGGHKSAAAFATNKIFFDKSTISRIDIYKDLLKY